MLVSIGQAIPSPAPRAWATSGSCRPPSAGRRLPATSSRVHGGPEATGAAQIQPLRRRVARRDLASAICMRSHGPGRREIPARTDEGRARPSASEKTRDSPKVGTSAPWTLRLPCRASFPARGAGACKSLLTPIGSVDQCNRPRASTGVIGRPRTQSRRRCHRRDRFDCRARSRRATAVPTQLAPSDRRLRWAPIDRARRCCSLARVAQRRVVGTRRRRAPGGSWRRASGDGSRASDSAGSRRHHAL
jgi:hypothetical protein